MMDLLSLPTNVLCKVLCAEVTLKDLVHLDSAHCHNRFRHSWLQFLQSKQCTFECEIDLSSTEQLVWLNQKSVKSSRVLFPAEIEIQKEVSTYLRAIGSHIRTVTFQGGTRAREMVLVALHCTHLTYLSVTGACLTRAFKDILLRNPSLLEICCTEVDCEETEILAGVSLHRLQTLTVNGADCWEGCLWHETAFSETLHTVQWNDCKVFWCDLRSLFRNCPNMRSFSSEDIGPDSLLASNLASLQHLVNLSIANHFDVNDHCILCIATTLTQLRTLNVQHCFELTDECLQHIAAHAGDRLEVLYVDIKHPESAETEAILEYFSQKCTKLKYLNINCGQKVLCAGLGTSALVSGCSQMHTLVVNWYGTVSIVARGFIAKFRPQLKLLVHDESTEYNILTMPNN